jgi:hypothetical protein
MNTATLSSTLSMISQGEGVTVTRSTDTIRIALPRPLTRRHAIGIASVLWDTWAVTRCHVIRSGMQLIVDVSDIEGLPMAIVLILSAIDRELNQAGRQLRIVDGPPGLPSHARIGNPIPKDYRPHRAHAMR